MALRPINLKIVDTFKEGQWASMPITSSNDLRFLIWLLPSGKKLFLHNLHKKFKHAACEHPDFEDHYTLLHQVWIQDAHSILESYLKSHKLDQIQKYLENYSIPLDYVTSLNHQMSLVPDSAFLSFNQEEWTAFFEDDQKVLLQSGERFLKWVHKGYTMPRLELLNEWFVWNYGLKEVAEKVPHFMEVQGLLLKEGRLFPSGLITKNITPSFSFYNYMKNSEYSRIQADKILRVVLCSLQMAWEHCLFTHYDLHAKNILLQKNQEPRTYTFTFKNGRTIEIQDCLYHPTIIDYGMSHIQYQDQPYGRYWNPEGPIHIYWNHSYPMTDVHKLIVNMMILRLSDFGAYYSFFNPEVTRQDLIRMTRETLALLEPNQEYLSMDYLTYLDWMMK